MQSLLGLAFQIQNDGGRYAIWEMEKGPFLYLFVFPRVSIEAESPKIQEKSGGAPVSRLGRTAQAACIRSRQTLIHVFSEMQRTAAALRVGSLSP